MWHYFWATCLALPVLPCLIVIPWHSLLSSDRVRTYGNRSSPKKYCHWFPKWLRTHRTLLFVLPTAAAEQQSELLTATYNSSHLSHVRHLKSSLAPSDGRACSRLRMLVTLTTTSFHFILYDDSTMQQWTDMLHVKVVVRQLGIHSSLNVTLIPNRCFNQLPSEALLVNAYATYDVSRSCLKPPSNVNICRIWALRSLSYIGLINSVISLVRNRPDLAYGCSWSLFSEPISNVRRSIGALYLHICTNNRTGSPEKAVNIVASVETLIYL